MNFLFLPSALAFLALLWWQSRRPLRHQKHDAMPHALRNLTFALPALIVNRVALIPLPLLAAQWAQTHSIGLIEIGVFPSWLKVALGVAALDYAYYWWHIATHRVPLLWRFHHVHHADPDMDVSTAARFHWGELLISIAFRVAAVIIFGISPLAFLIYEVLFEISGQFHHSNTRLSLPLENTLSRVVVTPRLHGIHHSVAREEMDSNWGTLFSFWDALHRTRRDDVAQEEIEIGVPDLRHETQLSIVQLWKLPFRKP